MKDKPIAAGKSSFDLVDKDKVLAELNLQEDTVLLDVACGVGNYTIAAAEAMRGKGTIHAFDLWPEGIGELNRRADSQGIKNISAAVADVSKEIPLKEDSVDVCLIATALHDLVEENAGEGTLNEIARVLKTCGRLVIIEFKKIDGPPGPPKRIRLSAGELDDLVVPFGFDKEHSDDTGDYTYLSTYIRASRNIRIV